MHSCNIAYYMFGRDNLFGCDRFYCPVTSENRVKRPSIFTLFSEAVSSSPHINALFAVESTSYQFNNYPE